MERSTVGRCFQKANKGKQSVEDNNFHDCCLCYFASLSFTLLGLKIQNRMRENLFSGLVIFLKAMKKKMGLKGRLSRKFLFSPSVLTFASQYVYVRDLSTLTCPTDRPLVMEFKS